MFNVTDETIREEVAKLSTEELKKFLRIDCDDDEEDDDYDECDDDDDDEEEWESPVRLYDLKRLKGGISHTGFCPSLDLLSEAVKEFGTRTAGIWSQYRAEILRRYVSENIVPIAIWEDWVQLPAQKYRTHNVRCFAGTSKTVLNVSYFQRRAEKQSYRWSVNTDYMGYLHGASPTLEGAQAAAQEAFDNRIAAILRGEG